MSKPPTRIISARLREAREARGYSIPALAEALGVSRQAVAQFEVGQAFPGAQTISRIYELLNQPPPFFTTPRNRAREVPGTTFWRSLKRMKRHEREKVSRRLDWLQDIISYLEEFVEFPPVDLPAPIVPPEEIDVGTIEESANLVRKIWNLGRGPITDMLGLLESRGFIVVREAVEADDMDAVSRWQCGRPVIFLSADKQIAARSRFDAAHELGHLTLHSGVELDAKNITRIEQQANRFAGAFLLPADSFSREIVSSSVDHLISLKRRWKVSMAAMVYRCKELGLFSTNQVDYLWRQLSARNMRSIEPLDRELSVEEPRFIAHAAKMILDNGVQSKQDFLDRLLLCPDDIEGLCGMPKGTLNTTVVPLRIRSRIGAL